MAQVLSEQPPHEPSTPPELSTSAPRTPTPTQALESEGATAQFASEVLPDSAPAQEPPHDQPDHGHDHQRTESTASSHTPHLTSPNPAPTTRRPSTSTSSTTHRDIDRDAQQMVIDSLRLQIQDLISQVSQLNSKLVKSYDRVSDLEDDLHTASAALRHSTLRISQLELERTQHLSALNTGLLVEKQHVTAELNRLMEKATEEAAQRGQAESARAAIEKDLDDLSASLFGQANAMVAEARFERHLSERKVEDAERALKSAEEAVKVMQAQMQAMQVEREEAERRAREAEAAMGKGKWIERHEARRERAVSLRLLGTHTPYVDFMAFVAHLRVLHPASPHATPAMSTLLQLPFLVRLMTEDSEPTVRLDLAPSLNWLSRRSVLAAIHSGQLTIEPISAASLLSTGDASTYLSPNTTIAGLNSSGDNVSCALCGTAIFSHSLSHSGSGSGSSSHSQATTGTGTQDHTPLDGYSSPSSSSSSWSGATAFFKKASGAYPNGISLGAPAPPSRRASLGQLLLASAGPDKANAQIFIFRLASPPSSSIPSLPTLPIPSLTARSSSSHAGSSSGGASSTSTSTLNTTTTSTSSAVGAPHAAHPISLQNSYSTNSGASQPTTIYPLCQSGWCLARLRTTCTLWAFVRSGIVDKVWEEEIPPPPPPPHHHSSSSSSSSSFHAKSQLHPQTQTQTQTQTQAQTHTQGQIPPAHLPPSSISPAHTHGDKPPPVPPRKRGLWGIASAIGERAASWSGSGSGGASGDGGGGGGEKRKAGAATGAANGASASVKEDAPPQHPSSVAQSQQEARRMPLPLPPSSSDPSTGGAHPHTTSTPTPAPAQANAPPPPLPKRNEGRSRTPVQTHPSPAAPPDQTSEPSSTHLQPNPTTAPHASTSVPHTSTSLLPPPASTATPAPATAPAPAPTLPPRSHARTPSTIPLPDSRPGTPGGLPSRAASPAVHPPTSGSASGSGSGSVSASTGSAPPPPPIPRRAAARARGAAPGAAASGGGGMQGSRPGTPANSAGGEKSHLAEEVKVEEDREGQEGGKKDEVEFSVSAAAPDEGDAAGKIAEREKRAEAMMVFGDDAPASENSAAVEAAAPQSVELASDDAEPADRAIPVVDTVSQDTVKEEKQNQGAESKENREKAEDVIITDSPIAERPEPDINGIASTTEHKAVGHEHGSTVNGEKEKPTQLPLAQEEVDAEYVHINGVGGEKTTGVSGSREESEEERELKERERERETRAKEAQEKENQQQEAEAKAEKARQARERDRAAGFIGDATWEERTWRELVRLREDMFWARVGAFRELRE